MQLSTWRPIGTVVDAIFDQSANGMMTERGHRALSLSIHAAIKTIEDALSSVVEGAGECILALLTLKAVSDLAQEDSEAAYSITRPPESLFTPLLDQRKQPGNFERFRAALSALEHANPVCFAELSNSTAFQLRPGVDALVYNKVFARVLKLVHVQPPLHRLPAAARAQVLEQICSSIDWTSRAGKPENAPPLAIAELIAELAQPAPGDRIYDPACGNGTVLLACARKSRAQTGQAPKLFWGQESNAKARALARQLAFLEGEHLDVNRGDALIEPVFPRDDGGLDRHFDVVVSCVPELADWDREAVTPDPWGRFGRGLPPRNRADLATIAHMLGSLAPQAGRMVVLVPAGVVFREGHDAALRRALVEENLLEAVISLPSHLFKHTKASTALLCIRTQRSGDNVLMVDASKKQLQGTKYRSGFARADMERILLAWTTREAISDFSTVVTREQVAGREFSLNPSQYITAESGEPVDREAVKARIRALRAELRQIEDKLDAKLEDLRSPFESEGEETQE